MIVGFSFTRQNPPQEVIAIAWCVYCRAVIPNDAERCPSCGKPLSDGSKVIQCPSCGKYILKNSNQCRFCGVDPHAKLSAEALSAAETSASAEDAASSTNAPAAEPAVSTEAPSEAPSAPAEPSSPAESPVPPPKPRSDARRSEPEPSPAKSGSKTPPRKKRKWLLIPIVLVLTAGLFFGGRAIFGGKKKDADSETRSEYIASCKAVSYAMIARDPSRYEGSRLSFSGTVTELVPGGTIVFLIEQINLDAALGSDVWYATYTPPEDAEHILREGDEITVYGECTGPESYLSQPGETETIPSLRVLYYENADLERLREAQQGTVLAVGETWTIDGLCTVTVTGVTETKDRAPNTKKEPIAVYYVDYTYTNLGYESESADGIYVAIDESILDSAGQMGYSYPNAVSGEPRSTPVGETCTAQCCIGLEHVGPFQLLVNVNDPVFNTYTARFNIMPE